MRTVTEPESVTGDDRLLLAYQRYKDRFSTGNRAGSPAALEMARARMDLALALAATGDDLPELVSTQLQRDATALLSTTEPLP